MFGYSYLRRDKKKAPKLQSNWEGPFKIVRKLSKVVFGIKKSARHKCKIVHVDRLAIFVERQSDG